MYVCTDSIYGDVSSVPMGISHTLFCPRRRLLTSLILSSLIGTHPSIFTSTENISFKEACMAQAGKRDTARGAGGGTLPQ